MEAATTVMTVTGPVPADELGVVLPHEHVFTNTMREYRGNGMLHDPDVAVRELKDFVAHGGRTLVEASPRAEHATRKAWPRCPVPRGSTW